MDVIEYKKGETTINYVDELINFLIENGFVKNHNGVQTPMGYQLAHNEVLRGFKIVIKPRGCEECEEPPSSCCGCGIH